MIITFEPKRNINVEALSDALKVLSGSVAGISVVGNSVDTRRRFASQVEVVLIAPLTPDADTAIRNAIAAHNADTLTAGQVAADAQEAERDAIRQGKVDAALAQIETDLAAIAAADTAALKAILARTIQRQRAIIKAVRYVV
jgi:hypothetical protein